MIRPLLPLLLTLLMSFSGLAQAERFKAFGNYEVHYNAFNSSFLPAEVAQAYSIQRSKVRGLINVAVLDRQHDKRPTEALVQGEVKNLVGQSQSLEFQKISEGDAVYYIAQFRFTDDEILGFELRVQPDPNGEAYPLVFKQHFYQD